VLQLTIKSFPSAYARRLGLYGTTVRFKTHTTAKGKKGVCGATSEGKTEVLLFADTGMVPG